MSQQPYQQPGQPGQPGGYPPPGQPGYPQGGYQQPGQPPAYGGYPGGPGTPQSPPPYSGPSRRTNPLDSAATLAPILQIVGYVVVALGVLAGILSFTVDFASGTSKFINFLQNVVFGLGFGGVLLALSAFLKGRSSS